MKSPSPYRAATVRERSVGRIDDVVKAIAAFVTLRACNEPSKELKNVLRQWVAKEIGALVRPGDLPHEVKGDTTTFEDLSVLARLKDSEE